MKNLGLIILILFTVFTLFSCQKDSLTIDNPEDDFIKNDLREFVGYKVGNYAVQGNFSFYDAVMTLKLNDGSTMVSEQAVATEWKDNKIYRERYYHA